MWRYLIMVKFNEDDFELFVNLSNPKKRYYYAEKIINNCVIEITTNIFRINYKIEIKRKNSLQPIAQGKSKFISGLNLDINNFFSLNAL